MAQEHVGPSSGHPFNKDKILWCLLLPIDPEAGEALPGLIGNQFLLEQVRFWLGEFNKPLVFMLESRAAK